MSVLLRGQDAGGQTIYRANTITLQGEQVYSDATGTEEPTQLFLPIGLK